MTLTVSLQDNDNGVLATAIKPLWVYPADPFADRREWLKKLNLRLYDPDGATAHRLDAAGVPYTLVGNADALAEGEPGIALIGEGLSFAVYLGLAGAMVKAAAGRPVLCLAPAGGAFAIPGTEGTEGETPARLRLPRAGIISDLDKRLDAEAWPRGMSAASRLTVKASRDQVVGEVQRGHDGWSWLECTYADSGTLVVCGFGIISQWDNSPTPRFLFARLLTYLDDRRSVNEERDRK